MAYESVVATLRDVVGGLVKIQNAYRQPTKSMFDRWRMGPATSNRYWKPGQTYAQACECTIPALYCFRSASQRSLDTPVTFLSSSEVIPAGNDAFEPIVQNANTGLLQGAGVLGTGLGLKFYDSNDQVQRERISHLVLWGFRVQIGVFAQLATVPVAPGWTLRDYCIAFERAIANSVCIEVHHLSDSREDWVSKTPVVYWMRPGEYFVPIPPVLWRDRDPYCLLLDRPADVPSPVGGLTFPEITLGQDVVVEAAMSIEGLWSPSPDECGNAWPGELCPAKEVVGTKEYNAAHQFG